MSDRITSSSIHEPEDDASSNGLSSLSQDQDWEQQAASHRHSLDFNQEFQDSLHSLTRGASPTAQVLQELHQSLPGVATIVKAPSQAHIIIIFLFFLNDDW